MRKTDEELLNAVKQMEEEAPDVGLCGFTFKVLYDEISKLIEERDALQEAQRWIPVTERLPETETDVEVAFDDGEVWMLWQSWASSDDEFKFDYGLDTDWEQWHTVTHWRPCPKAPQLGDNDETD